MKKLQELELYELYYLVYAYAVHGEEVVAYDMESVWKKICDMYFDENKNMLDIYDDNDRDILFKWMQGKCRYQLLDTLILNMFYKFVNEENNGLDNRDEFFINNIDMMNEIMKHEYVNINNKIYNNDINLSAISKNKTIAIVKEILLEIDANGEWLRIYEEALSNNRIIYLNELDSDKEKKLKDKLGLPSLKYVENTCLSIGKSKDWYIFLKYKNDISDVTTTIHEMVHFINKHCNKGEQEEPLLREFPSIFFELYAGKYLVKIGYDESEIERLNSGRLADTYMALNESMGFVYYLKMLIDNGKINEYLDKNYSYLGNNYHKNCDNCIKDLVINPYAFFEIYPYIIGNYLANKAIKNIDNDNQLLTMVKYITENLSRINVGDVFRIIVPEIEIIDDNENKTKVKKKK